MELVQQAIELLSEPPGSLIYHLVTLFALQIVLGISYSQWRKDTENSQALRFVWASGSMLLGRMIIIFFGLTNLQDIQQTAVILPPLEHAINTASIFLLVWALLPNSSQLIRFFDIMLVVGLITTTILYLFFAQEWIILVDSGITYYNGTLQATIWTIIQIIVLFFGLFYLLLNAGLQKLLPPVILLLLIFTTLINLFNQNEFLPADSNVPYFIRLGYLIGLPLWAVFTYQQAIQPLLRSEDALNQSSIRYRKSLEKAAEIISTSQQLARIAKSLDMAAGLIEADFVAIGLVSPQNPFRMKFLSNIPQPESSGRQEWEINLTPQSAFKIALDQEKSMELIPEGVGARQLFEFYKDAGIDPRGPLLIYPLMTEVQTLGLLVAGAGVQHKKWLPEKKELVFGLAPYMAQAIYNTQRSEKSSPSTPSPSPTSQTNPDTVPSAILIDQVRLFGLRAERDELNMALEKSKLETKKAQARALAAQKQARYLAAALRAAQKEKNPKHENQAEIDTMITNRSKKTSSEGNSA